MDAAVKGPVSDGGRPATDCRMKFANDGSVKRNKKLEEENAYRDSLTFETCLSFAEWIEAGWMIRKGAKSMYRDIMGVPQFTQEQVFKPHKK